MIIQTYKLNKYQRYRAKARLTCVRKSQTNLIRLVGTVPGAGKSTTLVKAVIEAYKAGMQKIVILAKDNLAIQNIKSKFEEFEVKWQKVATIQTLKSFKQNYKRFIKEIPRYDIETGEIKDVLVSENYITCHSKKHFRYTYNVFIDEAANISDIEIKDLKDNWRINNLVLCGDANQFKPIPSKHVEYFGEEIQEEWNDDGSLYTERGKTVLLNKSFRSIDPKLTRVIENIKNSNNVNRSIEQLLEENGFAYDLNDFKLDFPGILTSNKVIHDKEEMQELLRSATHIAYTNKEICKVNRWIEDNKLKTDDLHYIVRFPDYKIGLAKNDRIKLTDSRIEKFKEELFAKAFYRLKKNCNLNEFNFDKIQKEADKLWEEWKNNHLELAQAVTCHKMQGATTDNNIIIHLDDFLTSVVYALEDNLNEEEQAKQLQTFLYIAISRARKSDQINLLLNRSNKYLVDKFNRLVSLMKPMMDETIVKEDIVYEGPAGEEAVQTILDNLRPDNNCNVTLQGQKEYQARICKAHQHYTDTDIALAIKLSFKEFKEVTGLTSSRTFAKLRKIAKERNIQP